MFMGTDRVYEHLSNIQMAAGLMTNKECCMGKCQLPEGISVLMPSCLIIKLLDCCVDKWYAADANKNWHKIILARSSESVPLIFMNMKQLASNAV